MTHIIHQGYLFVILCFVGRTLSACRSLYPDLCGYNGNENNATEVEDYNGNICDCQQVMFCSVVELTEECNSVTVSFSSSDNITSCDILPLDSEVNIPVHKVSKINENEFAVEIFTEFSFGKFRIVCSTVETVDEVGMTNATQWNIVSVSPAEVKIDSEVKLSLTVAGDIMMDLRQFWCFIKTPDGDIQVLLSSLVSDTQIDCMGFNAGVPGLFMISLSSSMTSSTFDKVISIKATSKHPIVKDAVYSHNFEAIFIYFDENIELHCTCGSVFPKDLHEHFGVGFDCETNGNIFVVKMGQQFKIINDLMITGVGKICTAGSQGAEFCLVDVPLIVPILKPNVSGPSLSFQLEAPCGVTTAQKYLTVKTLQSKNVNLLSHNTKTPTETSGKVQRKNLIAWRTMRQFQRKLSSQHITVLLNTTDVRPLLENLPSVENLLGFNDNLNTTARVSVLVQSSPAIVLAEADVTFCKDSVRSFRYKWMVNDREVLEDGKILKLKDLTPGKYAIKCAVVDYNSTEVLGQGWATTEVLAGEEKIVIVPSEITVGTADEFSLRAITWHGSSASWTCRLSDNKECLTSSGKLVREAVNLNSLNVTIPAETLPVGVYVWTAESGRGSNTAKVSIKNGNFVTVMAEIPSVFVNPSQEVFVRGVIGKMEKGCRAWWSSVRQKGFDYFHLDSVGINSDILAEDIPLAVPPDSELWKKHPNSMYLFQLQVFCPSSSNKPKGFLGNIKVPIIVSNPPRVSHVTVHPLTGDAMITTFSISMTEASASGDDYPLTYELSYVDACETEIPIAQGTISHELSTYLPPGELKLSLRVCNVRKSCSTTYSPPVNVIQPLEFPKDNYNNARNLVERLMMRGDTLEAFGLATTVLKSLALVAEGEVRDAVYSTIEESVERRIEELTRRVRSNRKDVEAALDFFERAVTVVKYLRKGSDIVNLLLEFKNGILKSESG